MPATADLLIIDGVVFAHGQAAPPQAVAVRSGVIVATGSSKEMLELAGPGTEVIYAHGGSVLPGFIDAHNHARLGFAGGDVNLSRARSLEEIRELLRARAIADRSDAVDDQWLVGEGWNASALGGRMPTADDLDGVTAGRPAFLLSFDVHMVWMNRAGLARFGVDERTDRLPFGVVEKDARTGAPTGLITGFAVLGLSRRGLAALAPVVPYYGEGWQYRRLCASLEMAARYGITTVVEPQNSVDDLWLYDRARTHGDLRSRLVAGLLYHTDTTAADLKEFAAARDAYGDDMLRIGAVKLYADDVVEPHTAAFLEPYASDPHTCGSPFYEQDALDEAVRAAQTLGLPAFIHATGDRGIRMSLDAIAHAGGAGSSNGHRHQIVHVECPTWQDIPRFAELGVVACMQPRHAAPELTGAWRDSVGPTRSARGWPMRSLRESGAVLALSSDWNVAEMDPLVGIYSALTRSSLDGSEGWGQDQTLTLEQAVTGYTAGAAYSIFAEDRRGTIEVGKQADLAVLSDNVFVDSPRACLDTAVMATVVDGRTVYRRE